MKKSYIILIILILGTTIISGCTNTPTDFKEDITNDGDPIFEDNNDLNNGWFINGNLYTISGNGYKDVELKINLYNMDELVGTKNTTIDMSNGNGFYSTVIKANGTPTRVEIDILNATPL